MSRRAVFLKIILPLLILAIGAMGTWAMIKLRAAPQKKDIPFRGVLVETRPVSRQDHQVVITATGSVQAKNSADIVPQIDGRVVRVAPNLLAGGFFKAGEELFSLETIDFELAVQRAMANLAKAELELQTVKAQADIARTEWDRLHPGEDPPPLVVYQPQMKNAEAVLASARASLRQAELDLSRTRLTAPFNCYVRSENIDLGQYVRKGDRVATVVGTDEVEVIIPLPQEDLAWLHVPREPGEKGSPAKVTLASDKENRHWQGAVARSLGEVDSRGRMERVAVTVRDPYALLPANRGRPQLAVGSFVEVELEGAKLEEIVELPRLALRENDTVWVMDDRSMLRITPVKVVRRERETVLINEGLTGGEQVVVTPIAGAAEGMLLRTAEQGG